MVINMSVIDSAKTIISEISINLTRVKETQLQEILDYIQKSDQIFVNGAGRSGIGIKAFANRLLHLGLDVNVVGEISTKKANIGDLLIISSGSGTTESLIPSTKKAKNNGVKIVLFTTNPQSTIATLADIVIEVAGNTKVTLNENKSVQPMGSLFEQTCYILYDSIILCLMNIMSETAESMSERHANLE